MSSIRLLTVLALAFLSPVAMAKGPLWYAGIAAGEATTDRDLVTNRESTLTNATGIATDFDARDAAWKIFGGYRFNDWLGVEAGYVDLGRHSMLTTMQGGDPPLPASIFIERRLSGFGADLLASAALGGNFALLGRLGVLRSRLRATARLEGNIGFSNGTTDERTRSASSDEVLLRYGAGAEWWPRANLGLRLEWERYANVGKAFAIGGSGTTGEADTDLFSLGVVFRF